MALFLSIHPENPQPRLLKQAAQWLGEGGLVAVPTDSSYAVVARLDDKNAADRLRRLRGLDDRHHLTVLCRDLAEIGHFARSTTASTGCSRPPRPAPGLSSWKPRRKCRGVFRIPRARPSAFVCRTTSSCLACWSRRTGRCCRPR